MKIKKIMLTALAVVLVVTVSGCQKSKTGDVNSDNALESFSAILKEYPSQKGYHEALYHWGFKLPSGEKFEWSSDMSANKADFALVMLADPLVEAGLDVEKLDKNEWLYEPAGKDDMGENLPNRLIKPYNVSDNKVNTDGSEDSLKKLLKEDNSLIKYNEDQKHYRLLLGDGNEVQWTQELGVNNADMIFVIKAQPLIDAGLDVDKLEGSGWTFRETSNDNTVGENPDQLVKEFDIKE
jgi:hypothetical protein